MNDIFDHHSEVNALPDSEFLIREFVFCLKTLLSRSMWGKRRGRRLWSQGRAVLVVWPSRPLRPHATRRAVVAADSGSPRNRQNSLTAVSWLLESLKSLSCEPPLLPYSCLPLNFKVVITVSTNRPHFCDVVWEQQCFLAYAEVDSSP